MLYLQLANVGLAPIESFTILGVSSSRSKQDKLGMFGTGAKLGLNVFLRNNLNPTIFIGNQQLEFFTTTKRFKDIEYQQVCCSFNGEIRELSWSTDYGQIDWTDIGMGLRELVQNLLDAVDSPKDIDIRIVTKPEPINGSTVFYIPVTPEVQRYYNEIDEKFLHFYRHRELTQKILKKRKEGPARVYKKGVFVREIRSEWPSLYDYNLDDLKIDESRNLNDYEASQAIGKALRGDKEKLKTVLKTAITGEKYWETTISYYYMGYGEDIYKEVWAELYGENAVVVETAEVAEFVKRKGFKPILVKGDFAKVLENNNVKMANEVISTVEAKGNKIVKATQRTLDAVDRVWGWIEKLELTNGHSKPKVFNFSSVMEAESITMGYSDPINDSIYINLENPDNEQTILEELAHIITNGSTDLSRDFQDYAFRIAVAACRKVNL